MATIEEKMKDLDAEEATLDKLLRSGRIRFTEYDRQMRNLAGRRLKLQIEEEEKDEQPGDFVEEELT